MAESQRIIATRPLVDSEAEHALLERLIDASKPPLPPEPVFAKLHSLLYTPFRYPPLPHGSRFGRHHERSLWYGSERLQTALAETAYYRLVFFAGTAANLTPHSMPFSAFQASVKTTAAVDVSTPAFGKFVAQICSPADYSVSQALGSDLRAAAIDVVRYPSARDPGRGLNLGLFSPGAFARPHALAVPETWYCTVTDARDVEFRHERVTSIDTVEFALSDFHVDGKLPTPAT